MALSPLQGSLCVLGRLGRGIKKAMPSRSPCGGERGRRMPREAGERNKESDAQQEPVRWRERERRMPREAGERNKESDAQQEPVWWREREENAQGGWGEE